MEFIEISSDDVRSKSSEEIIAELKAKLNRGNDDE